MNKPPAFQFYAKDWRSSPTVRRMSLKEEGLFIRLCALAWDSEKPGTITMSMPQICHELRVLASTLRRFLDDFPTTWRREDGKLVQPKLHGQWLKYQEISGKRSAIAQQMHMQKGGSAFAFASASAIAPAKQHQQQRFALPEWVPSEVWKAYEEMRTKIRKPMTPHARDLAVKRLWTLKGEGHDPRAVLEQSILNSWQGLFEIRRSGSQGDFDEEKTNSALRRVFGKGAS
jgi:hypothetical protein